MTFELLDESSCLYPLYSDMEHSDTENQNRLCLPSSTRIHRRHRRNLKSQTPPRTRRIPHYDISCLSPFSVSSSPQNTPKAVRNPTRRRIRKKRRPKRRIRTFYSKKWGNKLYGLRGNYPIIETQFVRDRDCDREDESESASISIWQPPHTLDLNDLKSFCSPSISVSPSPNAYDSEISNIAANANTDLDIDEDESTNFKIIVSAPNRKNKEHEASLFNLRMNMKRNLPIYMSSDDESATDQFSSSEDDDDDDTTNGDELIQRSSLFLSGNNMNVGVYSDFGLSEQSDTDYMSAQSGDFDELTICYHQRKNDRNIRNIKFRSNNNYLSDNIGPSDIGSSDTDYFSSADSIPDSVPAL